MHTDMKQLTADEAYRRLSTLCAAREMCAAEARKKLAQWGVDGPTIEDVVARLMSEHYIDDARYARMFVRERLHVNRWGKMKIAYALRGKGIDEVSVSAALAEIDEREYEEILREVLAVKARGLRAATDAERIAKLVRFAASRGFEQHLTYACLRRQDEGDDE